MMHRIAAIVFATSLLLAQDTPKTVNSDLVWTRPTTNADDTPLTDLAGYQFLVAPEGIDLTVAGVTELQSWNLPVDLVPECPGDVCEFSARDLFEGLPDGRYRVWGKAYDETGNVSEFSPPSPGFEFDADAPFDPTSPKAPVDIKVENRSIAPKVIRITVEVPTE